MKLGLCTIISVASAGFDYFKAPRKGTDTRGNMYDRKHPSKVLSNANKMFCTKVGKNFQNEKVGERTCGRVTKMVTSLHERFGKRQCVYHNPLIKNGGPNPDPESVGARWIERDNGEGFWKKLPMRKRRDGSEDDEDDDYYGIVTGCEDLPEGSPLADFCDTDYDYEYEYVNECEGAECLVRGKNKKPKKKKVKKVKLNKTEKALKRSLLTITAWCSRHIRDCSGMRKHQRCIQRCKGIWEGTRPKLNGYKALIEGQKAPTL